MTMTVDDNNDENDNNNNQWDTQQQQNLIEWSFAENVKKNTTSQPGSLSKSKPKIIYRKIYNKEIVPLKD